MTVAHKWQPITDLPENYESLTDGELEPLHRVWLIQKEELAQAGLLEEFDQRLRREWAIETGIIEKVYDLDRGVTRTLIEQGIDAALIPHGTSKPEGAVVAQILQDHYDALDGIFDVVAGQRPLTTGYIKELHAALLRNQDTYHPVDPTGRVLEVPLEKGAYKRLPNSPTRNGSVHEYCPPEQVASEMDRLIEMYQAHQSKSVPPEVEAAWLHHRFTQIHPFADGNGRVARAMASLVFIKAGWFPLVVKRDDWSRYIHALEQSDDRDLHALVRVFVEAQRAALIATTEIIHDVRPIESVDEALAAIRDRLLQRGRIPTPAWATSRDHANALVKDAEFRLARLAFELSSQVSYGTPGFEFNTDSGVIKSPEDSRVHLVARIGAAPDLDAYNKIVTLHLNAGRRDTFELFFCSLAPQSLGLIAIVAYLTVSSGQPISLARSVFQINGQEDATNVKQRFNEWLEEMIIEGLKEWRKRL